MSQSLRLGQPGHLGPLRPPTPPPNAHELGRAYKACVRDRRVRIPALRRNAQADRTAQRRVGGAQDPREHESLHRASSARSGPRGGEPEDLRERRWTRSRRPFRPPEPASAARTGPGRPKKAPTVGKTEFRVIRLDGLFPRGQVCRARVARRYASPASPRPAPHHGSLREVTLGATHWRQRKPNDHCAVEIGVVGAVQYVTGGQLARQQVGQVLHAVCRILQVVDECTAW